jgi:hypothetical protein
MSFVVAFANDPPEPRCDTHLLIDLDYMFTQRTSTHKVVARPGFGCDREHVDGGDPVG